MEGIDVSIYQGNIDWNKVKQSGIDFAYIKASQGINSYDPMCQQNAQGVSQTGLKFGYYHFATLNNQDVFTDAKQEAAQLVQHLSQLPKASLSLALDIEQNNQLNLTPAQVENWIHTFINSMNVVGYKVILYSYTPFLNTNLPDNHTLGQYPLWIASYTKSLPILPKGFQSWSIWQWNDKGIIQGVPTNVDLNHARILQ